MFEVLFRQTICLRLPFADRGQHKFSSMTRGFSLPETYHRSNSVVWTHDCFQQRLFSPGSMSQRGVLQLASIHMKGFLFLQRSSTLFFQEAKILRFFHFLHCSGCSDMIIKYVQVEFVGGESMKCDLLHLLCAKCVRNWRKELCFRSPIITVVSSVRADRAATRKNWILWNENNMFKIHRFALENAAKHNKEPAYHVRSGFSTWTCENGSLYVDSESHR